MLPDLSRYHCQIALPGFGEAAQQLLQQARVLVVGAGGLGCPALQYLVAAGIGTIGIADDDIVSVTNLHRQILYGEGDIGKKKVQVAIARLQLQNPGIILVAHELRVNSSNALELINQYDIVVDGTDNFETRYLLNDAAVIAGKPLVYGAIYQYEGQLAVWNVKNADGSYSPNYRDLYPNVDATQIPNCAVGGVIPTLAGVIGCLQANEVIKLITRSADVLAGKVMVFDAQTLQSRIVRIGSITKTKIQSLQETASIPTISRSELEANPEKYELVDVRTVQEHDKSNIGGKNIPLDELEESIALLKKTTPIVFYCATGKRSAEAVKMVKGVYPDAEVYSLELGMGYW